METHKDLPERILRGGLKLSKGQKRIAEYVLGSFDKAAFMTASKLSQKVGVSESTVVRFAVALGYEGYPELQRAMQEMIRSRLTSVQRIELADGIRQEDVLQQVLRADMNNIRRTVEETNAAAFAEAVEILLSARRVYVVGLRSAAPLAQFLGYYLGFVLDGVVPVQPGVLDVREQVARIGHDDVLLGISFPRYSRRTLDAMRYASERGARCLAITDSPASPIGQIADCSLTAQSDMASFVDSLVAPLSVINALIVAVGLKRRSAVAEHLRIMEHLWDDSKEYAQDSPTL